MTKVLFADTSLLWEFSYGKTHPFNLRRLKVTQSLQKAKGLLQKTHLLHPKEAPEDLLLQFHTADYLRVLKEADSGVFRNYMFVYGLGSGDNPIFPGVYRYSRLVVGASYEAAVRVARGEFRRAFNMAGGLHHAMPDRASGFCYLNDPVFAILGFLDRYERILYLDVDGHHGDGVQMAFWRDSRVLTMSLHESGKFLFPGTGYEDEMGEGKGYGYALNIPFPPGAGDDAYHMALERVVFPAIERFSPQVVVSQLGADALRNDPLTHWRLTTNSYLKVLHFLNDLSVPWVALGGGGYNLKNVAKLWTLTLTVLLEEPIDLTVPNEWKEAWNMELTTLHDAERTVSSPGVLEEVRRVIDFLRSKHPLLSDHP
ncbi:MAG: acetoin utilization protein AcuC [Thermotogae bacterium]|nr:acetoin utilization protein AcuC [Thermotogota bacterium]